MVSSSQKEIFRVSSTHALNFVFHATNRRCNLVCFSHHGLQVFAVCPYARHYGPHTYKGLLRQSVFVSVSLPRSSVNTALQKNANLPLNFHKASFKTFRTTPTIRPKFYTFTTVGMGHNWMGATKNYFCNLIS